MRCILRQCKHQEVSNWKWIENLADNQSFNSRFRYFSAHNESFDNELHTDDIFNHKDVNIHEANSSEMFADISLHLLVIKTFNLLGKRCLLSYVRRGLM